MSRSNRMSTLCSIEENNYNYSVFVTLTFSPDARPYAQPRVVTSRIKGHSSTSIVLRAINPSDKPNYGSTIYKDLDCKSLNSLHLLTYKYNLPFKRSCYVPYASKYHLQNFIKRVRSKCSYYNNEKVRYYAVSEYSPIHFLPHYHIILFFNSPELIKTIFKAISSSWKYGIVNASLSRGKCSSYVAKYVNCVSSLPKFYGYSPILKPFSLHSNYFAMDADYFDVVQMQKKDYNSIMHSVRSINGKSVEYTPSINHLSYIFPKCKGFGTKNRDECIETYTILHKVSKAFGPNLTISQYTRCIIDVLYSHVSYLKICDHLNKSRPYLLHGLNISPSVHFVWTYFLQQFIYNHDFTFKENLERFRSQVYIQLSLSRHFLNKCCVDPFSYHEHLRVYNNIRNFWNNYSIERLSNFYSLQEHYFNELNSPPLHVLCFYSNTCFDVSNSSPYFATSYLLTDRLLSSMGLPNIASCDLDKQLVLEDTLTYDDFRSSVITNFSRCQKHKRQNDANNFFSDIVDYVLPPYVDVDIKPLNQNSYGKCNVLETSF